MQSWLRLSLFYLVIVGILGALLRAAFVFDLPGWIEYRKITHAHSHIAMLGWIYNGLFLAIMRVYRIQSRRLLGLFWLTQVAVIGMLFTFPVVGYAPLSIVFSTLHILLSYVFAVLIWNDPSVRQARGSLHTVLLKSSLVFLVLSSLGTFGLASMMVSEGRGTATYYASIQFYLHFQFNGWFLFAALAVLFKFLHNVGHAISAQAHRTYLVVFIAATCLTYALAVTWSTPRAYIFWINSAGALIQLIALWWLVRLLIRHRTRLRSRIPESAAHLLGISLVCLILKIVLQSLVAIPALAQVSYTVKNFVIGFIHLLNLGIVTTFLLAMFHHYYRLEGRLFRWGIILFIGGFVGTEALLFVQGIMLWAAWGFLPAYYLLMWLFSMSLLLGLVLSMAASFRLGVADD